MKRIIEPIIMALGFAAAVYGMVKMAKETVDTIIPAWMIIFIIDMSVCVMALAVGYSIKYLFRSRWRTVTHAAIVVIIVVVIYAIVDRHAIT